MKKSRKIIFIWLLMILTTGCGLLLDNTDPEVKSTQDAYSTLIEAHALKQVWMYNYFKLFSNNYQQGQLFLYDPTHEELDAFLEELALLVEYADTVDASAEIIQNSQNTAKLKSANGLVDAMSGFYNWASGAGERSRDRIKTIVSHMTASQKSELYNDILRSEWKSETTNEADFWAKLESGKFDTKAPQIYNDFYHFSAATISNPFFDLAQKQGLTPAKIVVKEGAEGIEKGAGVIVEAAKSVTPLGKGIDILEEGKKWYEKAEKAVDKPMDLVQDEIKERLAGKLGSFVDIDGNVNVAGLSESVGKVAGALMQASVGTDNPSEIIEKVMDWGLAKLKSPDNTIVPDIIFAENKAGSDGIAQIVLGAGTLTNQFNEVLLAMPKGSWDFFVFDNKGQTDVQSNISILPKQETSIAVSINEIEQEIIDPIDVGPYNAISIRIQANENTSLVIDNQDIVAAKYHPLILSGNSFSCNWEIEYDNISSAGWDQSLDVSGNFQKDENGNLMVSMTIRYKLNRYKNKEMISARDYDAKVVNLPFGGSEKPGVYMLDYYEISSQRNTELMQNLPDYLSMKYINGGYWDSSTEMETRVYENVETNGMIKIGFFNREE
ncbi:MAG: hypothetical protein ACERKD_09920 [Prolixibacteraceae bacterium]